MSYGAELLNQWEQLEALSAKNIATLDKYSEFLRERSKIDADYAKAVNKLTKSYRDDHNKTSKIAPKIIEASQASPIDKEYSEILNTSEELATFHQTLSDEYGKDLRNSIKNQIKELEKTYKVQFDKIRVEIANYKKAVDNIERAKAKYEKAVKDMDSSRKAYEAANQDMNATKKDIEKLRTQAERQATASYEAEAQYKKLIEETNSLKKQHFNETLPTLLNEFQTTDANERIVFTKNAFNKYSEVLGGLQGVIEGVSAKLNAADSSVSPEEEHNIIISVFKGEAEVENTTSDFVFEERQLQTEPTAKASTRGFTKQSVNDDNKEDAIIAIPPSKQGRKKAADRLKILDKELAEVEKKLQSLANFISIYQAKPDLNADINVKRDLDDQNRALNTRINQINKKRYKLQVYIATIDGTQPPAPPAGVDAAALSPLSALPSPLEPVVDVSTNNIEESSNEIAASNANVAASSINVANSNANVAISNANLNASNANVAASSVNVAASSANVAASNADIAASNADIAASNASVAVSNANIAEETNEVEEKEEVVPVTSIEAEAETKAEEEDEEEDVEQDLQKEPIAKAKVLYDFDASPDSEELTVKAGQEIDVLEKQDDGWWKARVNEARIVGYLPGTYVQEI